MKTLMKINILIISVLFISLFVVSAHAQIVEENYSAPTRADDSRLFPAWIELAIQDLALRLRVSSEEIKAWPVNTYIDTGVYTIQLSHPLIIPMQQGALAESSVNPQPFGTYTYTIRATGRDSTNGSTSFVIEQVKYFDGSFDKYEYKTVESYQGTILKISKIDQFDKDGTKKASILYGGDSNISEIIHYTPDGKIKYVDEYKCIMRMDDIIDSEPVSIIVVNRFEGELRTPETNPICTFYYSGKRGQEKLQRAEFPGGINIIYRDDLAREVWDSYPGTGLRAELLMTFEYTTDNGGNIIATIVKYANGREEIIEGLADAADVVYKHINKNADLIKRATDFVKQKTGSDKCDIIEKTVEESTDGKFILLKFSTGVGKEAIVKMTEAGRITEFTKTSTTHNAPGRVSVASQKYNGQGQLIETISNNTTHDSGGKILINSSIRVERRYNENGTLAMMERNQSLVFGNRVYSSESVSSYDERGVYTGGYSMSAQHDSNGRLLTMSGSITVKENGALKTYSVRYDINKMTGEVTYTHVYLQGKEIVELGGKGVAHTSDIYNKVNKPYIVLNEDELPQRISVKQQMQTNTAGARFVNNLAVTNDQASYKKEAPAKQ